MYVTGDMQESVFAGVVERELAEFGDSSNPEGNMLYII